MRKSTLLVFLLLFVACLLAVWKYLSHESDQSVSPDVIAEVQVTYPRYSSVSKTLEAYGTVTFDPDYMQIVNAPIDIIVQKILIIAGQEVNTADDLLQYSLTTAAMLNVTNAKNDLLYAEKQLQNILKLHSQYMATTAEVESAKFNLEMAKTKLNSLQVSSDKMNLTLQSNQPGIINSIMVTSGQLITQGSPILSIANKQKLLVNLGIEPQNIDQVKVGQSVRIYTSYNDNTFTGAIKTITSQINPQNSLLEAIIPIATGEGKHGILLGTLVKGIITISTAANQLTLPRQAILYDKSQTYVYINKNGFAHKQQVTIGFDNGKIIQVITGVNTTDPVIIHGNYELQDGMQIKVKSYI